MGPSCQTSRERQQFLSRQLYAELWTRGLREPAHLPGRNPRGGWFHDFLGSWGEEETQLWLRYYASDEAGARHAKEYPGATLPPKEKPPLSHNWRCPRGHSKVYSDDACGHVSIRDGRAHFGCQTRDHNTSLAAVEEGAEVGTGRGRFRAIGDPAWLRLLRFRETIRAIGC